MRAIIACLILLGACDINFDLPLEQACALFRLDPVASLPEPRQAGEPCSVIYQCDVGLYCLCQEGPGDGVCLDPVVLEEI